MSLITCPECGHAVSDRAPACPQCGCPIEARPTAPRPAPLESQTGSRVSSWLKKIGVAVICMICFFVVKAVVLGSKAVFREAAKKEIVAQTVPSSPEEAARQFAEGINATPLDELRKAEGSQRLVEAKAWAEGSTVHAVRTYEADGLLPVETLYAIGKRIGETVPPNICEEEEIKMLFQYDISVHALYKTTNGQFWKSLTLDKETCESIGKEDAPCGDYCFNYHFECDNYCKDNFASGTQEEKMCSESCSSVVNYCFSSCKN